MGRVLPMPVGRQERMWCLSSSSTTAAVMSACNCHIFLCHSVSDQVFRHHLKVMQTRRECWVVMLQSSVSIHDLESPLQKERIPTYYPVHVDL